MISKIKLGEYVEILSGYAFKSNLFNDEKIGMPIIRIRDVSSGTLKTYYSGEYQEQYVINSGDLLITMDGEFKIKQWEAERGLLNQRVCKISSSHEDLETEYLLYLLPTILKKIEDRTAFVTVKHLSVKDIKETVITLPKIEVQRKIVQTLKLSEGLIAKRQSQITALDELTQSVFLKMFFSDLRGEKMPFESAILDLKYGTSEKSGNEGVPVLRIPNISDGIIDENDLKRCHFEEKTYESLKLQTNDLLFVRSNGNPNYVGRCAKVTEKQQGYVYASYLIRAKIDINVVHPDFIVYYLNTDYGRREVLKMASTSAGQYNINTKGLKNLAIIVPLLDRQKEFVNFKKKIDAKKYSMEKSLNELNNLFDSLLQRAFKGEIFQEQTQCKHV
ncbi:restriction endonuclease subunit S [Bacillus sp. Cr_A10]|uniref:restriction endonuclease subunit S n=1 Tax=Bacillus sp. Cr_A10 TaxID=3033993 RepID=UPI0023DC91DA|nr:restriction endonuclease subunit S [Bacillus sp. Cr_A10]MDF2065493.1 restriction endonuclease subunit S [Bacillus sp. Cr_A10]